MRHGTLSRYTHRKCRCRRCTAANAAHSREVRSRPLPPGAPHGSYSTYVNHRCRCEPCRATNARASSDRRARRKVLLDTSTQEGAK